ncbi:LysR family transcriptional regulator [Caballeronia sp. GAWG2-1]|uniref:LysR family transcriptional regulator n=1 Tax=Caballeronia sp. GAWG2-1 TaxID=2921744 RepID=UPI0020279B3F|nr:LysR family transcriptional regulator [Caballeronia sp. GAWG2-1]
MNIELARTFLEVVSTGSMANAADRLHVTHSTVTMRIKALEDILRRRVLIRSKTGVTMTPEGVRFHRFAETLVRTWQMTRRQMSLSSEFNGILSVGCDQSLWDDVMFQWVVNTRRTYPGIAVRCENGDSEYLVNRLFQGWLDFCIVYEARATSGFTVEFLFDDPMVIASTEDRTLRDSWDPSFIEIDWDAGVKAQEEYHWGAVDETAHVSVMGAALGRRLVHEFGGSVLVPVRTLHKNNAYGILYPVKGSPLLERKAYLVYSESLRERVPDISIDDIRSTVLALVHASQTDIVCLQPASGRQDRT